MKRVRKCFRGFTLPELLVVVAVVGIIAAMAAPSFKDTFQNNQADAGAEQLAVSLNYARLEAIKLGAPVSVCASDDGASCSNNWSNGWIVFRDGGIPGALDGADTVLRAAHYKPGALDITLDGYEYIQFTGTGTVNLSTETHWGIESPLFIVPRKKPFSERIYAALSPMRVALADDDDDDDDGNSIIGPLPGEFGTKLKQSDMTFDVCNRAGGGHQGAVVVISSSGQVSVRKVTCP